MATDFAIRITGDSSNAQKAVDQFGNKLQKTFAAGKTGAATFFGSFGGSFAGNVFSNVAGQASTAIADFFGGSREQASDLNETLSANKVIFGEQAAAIEAWGSTAYKNFGLSKQAAVEAAVGFGDMFLQLGFTGEAASQNSQDIVQMAADLGSFKNLETGDVLDRISGALRGEYDSLQAVIPNINAARVESEALAMTGKKTASELTAQEKAAATLAIIQKDGARATGDFARTQDGAANKSKIAAAALADQQAVLGEKLLPIYTEFQSFLITHLVPAISAVTGWVSENTWALAAVGGIILAVMVPAFIAWAVSIWATTVALLANPITWIILAIIALIAIIVLLVLNWDNVVKWITQVWAGFISWITGVIEGFVGWWNGIWAAVGKWISDVWRNFTLGIRIVWNGFWGWLTGVVGGLVRWWNGIWAGVGRFIGDVWRNFTLGIRILWNGFWGWITGVITGFGNWIRTSWENIWSGLGSIVRGVWNGILGWVEGGVNGAIDLINNMIRGVNAVGGVVGVNIGLIPHVSLPRLATGGLTSGPMIAMIGDNPGGRELVTPLNRAEQMLERAYEAGSRSQLRAVPTPTGPTRIAREDLDYMADRIGKTVYPLIVQGAQKQIRTALGG